MPKGISRIICIISS